MEALLKLGLGLVMLVLILAGVFVGWELRGDAERSTKKAPNANAEGQ